MENIVQKYTCVLSIAGSDSGGCAGIQADIKSMSACGVFAATVITASTAQNTQGVSDIHPMPVAHIAMQLEAVLSDISFQAIKIGMLHSSEVIAIVKEKLEAYSCNNIVIDPVMVATSGDKLITDEAINSLKAFLPQARLITPNIDEAEILLGDKINPANVQSAAIKIGEMYQTSVLLKGGHLDDNTDNVTDILFVKESQRTYAFTKPRIDTSNTHGTGCSLSSAVAAFIARGYSLELAVEKAGEYIYQAIARGASKQLGRGNGPINHFGLG